MSRFLIPDVRADQVIRDVADGGTSLNWGLCLLRGAVQGESPEFRTDHPPFDKD